MPNAAEPQIFYAPKSAFRLLKKPPANSTRLFRHYILPTSPLLLFSRRIDSSSCMRMSCNGCRVLRKGCSDSCSIRPCLQWIESPESQANATVFLAKFYGRAGFVNLIRAGPEHLRPAMFRSLLYEACGRIINPVYGSVGLLWSGRWQLCHAAVEAVLNGAPVAQTPSEAVAPPVKAYDIRHVSKADAELRKLNKGRTRFKRSGARTKLKPVAAAVGDGEKRGDESAFSAEAASHVGQGEASSADQKGGEVGLTLTLGTIEQASRAGRAARPAAGDSRCDVSRLEVQTCILDLCLQQPEPPSGLIRWA